MRDFAGVRETQLTAKRSKRHPDGHFGPTLDPREGVSGLGYSSGLGPGLGLGYGMPGCLAGLENVSDSYKVG